MKILVSNDDGVFSPWLEILNDAVANFGSTYIVAPMNDHSGASNSLTLDRPLTVRKIREKVIGVNGTPTDCVHLAITGLLGFTPDIVVSGVNNGPNLGEDTIYSGTVAAAMEGMMLGVPSVAFSMGDKKGQHYDTATQVITRVIESIKHQISKKIFLLNVNIPNVPLSELDGYEVTRLGRRHKSQGVIEDSNPRGEKIYWIGAAGDVKDKSVGTDFHALALNRVSITPLKIDLTDSSDLDAFSGVFR
jgi:5'-nucleotidase